MKFLDANVILRYLTCDDPKKAENCYELFQKVKKSKIKLITCEAVIAEVVYVLSSHSLYNLPRDEICSMLQTSKRESPRINSGAFSHKVCNI